MAFPNSFPLFISSKHRLVTALSLLCAVTLLSGCSEEPPSKTEEYAIQGIRDGNFNNSGSMAVIASINHGGSLWNAEKGERLFNWNHQSGEYSDLTVTAISPDGGIAMTADTKNIVAWNTQTGRSLGFWTAPSRLHSLAINQQGRIAAFGRQDNLATIFDINAGQIIRSLAHEHTIRSVSFVPNSNYLLTGSEDKTANVWDWQTGQRLRTWNHTYPVDVVVSNHQSSVIFVSAYMDNGYLYDMQSGNQLATTDTQRQRITAARFSSDDSLLALGFFDGRVQLRNAETAEIIKTWQVHIRPNVYREASHITDLTFHDKEIIALGSNGLLNHFPMP